MERGNFFPLPAPSSALYFLEGPLVTHYSWALTVAVGKKCCPFDQGKSKAEEGSVAGRRDQPPLLAAGVLPAFPVCCHGCAEMGLLVPALRGEVSLSALL